MGMKRAHSFSFTYPQKGYSLTHDTRACLSKIGYESMVREHAFEKLVLWSTIVAELMCYNEICFVSQKGFSVICIFCIITIYGEHSAGVRDMILSSIGTR